MVTDDTDVAVSKDELDVRTMSQALARLNDGRSQMERCLFIKDEIELPLALLEDVSHQNTGIL